MKAKAFKDTKTNRNTEAPRPGFQRCKLLSDVQKTAPITVKFYAVIAGTYRTFDDYMCHIGPTKDRYVYIHHYNTARGWIPTEVLLLWDAEKNPYYDEIIRRFEIRECPIRRVTY